MDGLVFSIRKKDTKLIAKWPNEWWLGRMGESPVCGVTSKKYGGQIPIRRGYLGGRDVFSSLSSPLAELAQRPFSLPLVFSTQ